MTRLFTAFLLLAAWTLSRRCRGGAASRSPSASRTTAPSGPGDYYVLWKGRVHGGLRPRARRRDPFDLDKAQRNERGKVEYAFDPMLLMPATTRPRATARCWSTCQTAAVPTASIVRSTTARAAKRAFNPRATSKQGTGFLEDRGFSLAEVQWELGKVGRRPAELRRTRRQDARHRGRGLRDLPRHRGVPVARLGRCGRSTANDARRRDRSRAGERQVAERPVPQDLPVQRLQPGEWPRRSTACMSSASGSGMLPILTSSTGPQSSGDAAPSFTDPEFRGVHEGPFTIGEIVAVEKSGEVPLRIVMVSSTTDFPSLRARLARPDRRGGHRGPATAGQRADVRHRRRLACQCCRARLHARCRWLRPGLGAGIARDLGGARSPGRPQRSSRPPDSKLMPLELTATRMQMASWARPSIMTTAVVRRPGRDTHRR